jgi:DeoR family transcriptional regulator, aga operon transcriptional repressor
VGESSEAPQSGIPELTRAERLQRVLELLDTMDSVQVTELSDAFAVSEVTVRHDLAHLAEQGLVARVRGGVRALPRAQSELAFDARLRVRADEKRAMAQLAAKLVVEGESVALDSSTSAYYLALELRRKRELVVVTNGLLIAAALAEAPGVTVLLTGGMLRQAAMSVVGDLAAEVLQSTRIDKGFFGARGLSLDRGLLDLNPDEVRFKQHMVAACERVIGLFDGSKWQRSALLSFVPAERVHAIVTDAGAPAELVAGWRERGVEVHAAQPAATGSNAERVPDLLRARDELGAAG